MLGQTCHSRCLFLLASLSIKVFHLPEQQVQILHPVEKLRAGDVIYAVYPDTTSFYQVRFLLQL